MALLRVRVLRVLIVVTCLMAFSTNAFAIDKRLKLLFRTAGYGAAAGLVLGAASTAMGMGGLRNIFMGASAGLYAGIALAGFIILTPVEHPRKGGNPYSPRKPVSPDDSDFDDDQIQEMVPNRDQPQSMQPAPAPGLSFEPCLPGQGELLARERFAAVPTVRLARDERGFWLPMLGLGF